MSARFVGIDLAASPEYGARRYNPVGLAALDGDLRATTACGRFTDAEILAFVGEHLPAVVAIDSPLSLPKGRCCADPDCNCARFGVVRAVDREIARLGHHPYWPLLPSMRSLTMRGIALRRALVAHGLCVREVFPGGTQDVLGIPRKQHGPAALADGIRALGVGWDAAECTHHELDALTAAYTAYLYATGRYTAVGPADEAQVIYPVLPAGGAARRALQAAS